MDIAQRIADLSELDAKTVLLLVLNMHSHVLCPECPLESEGCDKVLDGDCREFVLSAALKEANYAGD